MAYTIPEYVDTTEQAILAVASAVKGEQVTGGDGNVGTALDILADALAGENVEVPMTQQGAILALAQYVGGGGGGVTLGNVCTVFVVTGDDTYPAFYRASIDGALKASATTTALNVASGFSLDAVISSESEPTVTATVTTPDETTVPFTDFTVEPDTEYEGDYHIMLTVPDLPVDDTDPSDPVYSTLVFTMS